MTVNSNQVRKGNTQRTSGWHTDGFQGAEVIDKQENDFYFVNYNNLPIEYSTDFFNLIGFNENIHNYFKILESQILKINKTKVNHTYLFSSNFVHRATMAKKTCDRYFVRIGFSKVPITSVKMTLNPNIEYNYTVHQTSGNIPLHLKTSI